MDGTARKPSKRDVSRPLRSGDYGYKRQFYRSSEVADDYDFHRWGSRARAKRNSKKWRAILTALESTEGVRSVLDLPCGTGRFTGDLAGLGYSVVGSDISREMMGVARRRLAEVAGISGYMQADAERLALADGAVDCVISIRFLFHADSAARVRMVREMARVSRRWLILDYRHKYSYRYVSWRFRRALGLTDKPFDRVSRSGLERECQDAGVDVRRVIAVTRVFSDKWVVVCEKML